MKWWGRRGLPAVQRTSGFQEHEARIVVSGGEADLLLIDSGGAGAGAVLRRAAEENH
eukprot:gene4460-6873_t